MKIRLGPAGNCLLAPGEKTADSLRNLSGMGLDAQEIEFVRNTYMKNPEAGEAGRVAKKLGIKLSVHSSYFVNLASVDKEKLEMSKKRILSACERMHHMGGGPVVFHPSYFGGMDKEQVFQTTKRAILEMMDVVKGNKWRCELAPETTGRHSALGSLDETIRMSRETGCSLCVDFAHLFARNYGKLDFGDVFDKLRAVRIDNLHCHFSGIEYTEKGERHHLTMEHHKPDFGKLARALLKQRWLESVTIISESPVTWKDSLEMKKVLETLGHTF